MLFEVIHVFISISSSLHPLHFFCMISNPVELDIQQNDSFVNYRKGVPSSCLSSTGRICNYTQCEKNIFGECLERVISSNLKVQETAQQRCYEQCFRMLYRIKSLCFFQGQQSIQLCQFALSWGGGTEDELICCSSNLTRILGHKIFYV